MVLHLGGALVHLVERHRLTPHLHLLLPEAQWQPDGEVVPLPPPSDEEVRAVLAWVLRQAKKDWAALEAGWAEDEYEELQQRALQERLGLLDAQRPRPRVRRLAVLQGFSLHADTAVHGHDRQFPTGSTPFSFLSQAAQALRPPALPLPASQGEGDSPVHASGNRVGPRPWRSA